MNNFMNNLPKLEQPKLVRIEKIIKEAKDIKSFVFKENIFVKPGQYIMLWIPRVNEKPFSISYADKNRFAITVSAVGDFSKKLHHMKAGDFVGIRGPYGNHFKLFDAETKTIALVGGGYGAAPLAFLANKAKTFGYDVHFIIGAKTKDYLLYEERMKKSGVKTYYCTDDGSYGFKGFTTQLLEKEILMKNIGKIFACGPDMMLKKVIEIAEKYKIAKKYKIAEKYNIPCEISMERYMKCGIGICGCCCLDYLGLTVCKDGPVFDLNAAKRIVDLGKYKRDEKGSKMFF